MNVENGYYGWKNYQTWNVSLWIGNDEGLYNLAKECKNDAHPYKTFVKCLKEMLDDGASMSVCFETPDGVAWNDSGLDIEALDEMIGEL